MQTAHTSSGDSSIRKGEKVVDGKSMLDVLTLAAEKGTKLVLEASGDGAQQVIDALEKLFKTNFAAE